MTENELIQALQQKQHSAFSELVDVYKDRLYNTILGFVQNFEDAEDILQDVFIKIYQNIHQFKGEATLATWTYRIAISYSLDHLRRKKRQKKLEGILSFLGMRENETSYTEEFNHPGVMAENKEQAATLFKAIKQLPENQKTAFILQKIEGLKQEEIARVLKISEGAVESQLSRAKANLKKLLTEYYTI